MAAVGPICLVLVCIFGPPAVDRIDDGGTHVFGCRAVFHHAEKDLEAVQALAQHAVLMRVGTCDENDGKRGLNEGVQSLVGTAGVQEREHELG